MAGTKTYKAIENGTLNNPYRFVPKDSTVELTEEEQKTYAKSKWLLPLHKANAIQELPLMPYMGAKNNTALNSLEAINQLPVNKQYDEQMKTIMAGEQREDAKASADAEASTTETTGATGTGNLNPLG